MWDDMGSDAKRKAAMHAWPVGRAVGNVRNQGADLIAEAAPG